MAWDFETEPEFQRELDWMDAFVRDEIGPRLAGVELGGLAGDIRV